MLIWLSTQTKGKIMTKTLLIAATLFAAVASPALADMPATATLAPVETPAKQTFTRDGETYVYTTTQRTGYTLISGRSLTTGATFSLNVRGKRVSGVTNGKPVSFVMPK
jgi:hypothetical protein